MQLMFAAIDSKKNHPNNRNYNDNEKNITQFKIYFFSIFSFCKQPFAICENVLHKTKELSKTNKT